MATKPKAPKIFVDSSVLFSAIYSTNGHARDLIVLAENKTISLIINQFIFDEVNKNLGAINPLLSVHMQTIIKSLPIRVISYPKNTTIDRWISLSHPKDAPILAGGIEAQADFVISYDQKHLVHLHEKTDYPIPVLTPKEVITILRLNGVINSIS